MKKLLILGGAFQHCKVVETAKKKGIKVYVTDYLEDSPAKIIADVSLDYDVNDIRGIVEYCKKEGINGILNVSLDPCQLPYMHICHALNLPCYGDERQFEILTNKDQFKKCCVENGVDVIDSYTLDELDNIEFPVLVKPIDSRGSRGHVICNCLKDIDDAIKIAQTETASRKVIIEKYLSDAQDFTVAYMFIEGEAILLRTGDRYTGTRKNGLNNVAIAVSSPSKYSDVYMKNAHTKIVNMLKNIGIKNGPVFFQGFVDGNKVRLYDPGFRFSGGEYEKLFLKATGIDLISMLVDFAFTGKMYPLKKNDYSNLHGMRVIHLDPTLLPGRIGQIEGVEKIKNNQYVETFNMRYSIGDRIIESNDVRRRLAEICVITPDKELEINTIQYIQETLKVFDSNGQNMLCDTFNTGMLK